MILLPEKQKESLANNKLNFKDKKMVMQDVIVIHAKKKDSELTVRRTRNRRELVNPPSIVNNSDDASFPRYIS